MQPRPEVVHWLFATGLLAIGLCLLGEAVVGSEVWRRRAWRAYLFPSMAFLTGIFLWPVMVLFTSSTMHMLAHSAWAQVAMLAGAAQLGLVRGKLKSPYWLLTGALALAVTGAAFLIHEQNGWLFSRSAFVHHALGWTLVSATVFPLLQTFRPNSRLSRAGFALTFVVVAVFLYADRDVAPIFGHLSDVAVASQR